MSVEVPQEFALRVRRDEPMSRHTSWHVGGPAELFFNPRDRKDLAAIRASITEALDDPTHEAVRAFQTHHF